MVTQAAVRSNAVVLLLLIRVFYVPPIVYGSSVFDICFVMHYFKVSFLVLQSH